MNRKRRAIILYFYPRSPCGERPHIIGHAVNLHPISIHALLAESDGTSQGADTGHKMNFYPRSPCGERLNSSWISSIKKNFYPRSPCGERRQAKQTYRAKTSISIHALLAESDTTDMRQRIIQFGFLSTLSLRRATNDAINGCNPDFISIHALLAESDIDRVFPEP